MLRGRTWGGAAVTLFEMKGGAPFALAGLQEHWTSPEGVVVDSCTILTRASAAPVAALHDRMPCVLSAKELEHWLDPALTDVPKIKAMLAGDEASKLSVRPVSKLLNSVANDDARVLEAE
ncbi:MAG: SOS response-associated peptidase [Polyangiales bacterium]